MDHKRILDEHFMVIRYTNMIGRLATLGLITVLLALTGFAIWTTVITLKLSDAVGEAVTVSNLYERAYFDLGAEESLEHEYSFEPSPDVRSQFQMAAAMLVKDLKAASSNEIGDPVSDQELVARVLSEHQHYLLAAAQLFAAVDAGDKALALAIDQTTLDPLMEQMKQQVNTLANEHSQEAHQRLTELEQTQHMNFTITPIVFSIGLVLFGLCWGVLQTYRRKLDEARQTELTQLEETARVKTQQVEEQRRLNQLKDQFIANVSHELRTPLTAVNGYIELLSDYQGSIDTPTQARFIRQVRQACDDLLVLTNTILEVSEVDHDLVKISCEPTPVVPVVQEILTTFDPRVVQEYTLEVDVPEHVTVLADEQALRQVLRNLLSNAFKYAPKGTPVSIRAVVDEHPQVCICVQDAGPGIPPSELPLLFQKFVRLKRDLSGPVRGSGLGLYISKRLIEAMHGQIWAESSGEPGEGSCFCFTLPRACDPAP
jgi:signal transduction histidine kinase